MNPFFAILAQAAPAGAPPGNALSMFIPMGIVFVIFYFLMIRPQQKKLKEHKAMLAQLKRGDEVITAGGIYGKVAELQDTTVSIQIAPNVVVKIERAQVSTVINPTAVTK